MRRQIIEIDEEKCNGCGQCVLSCAEGALEIVDGKAKLVGDIYCDGLGACIGECPEDALTIIEREAPEFDEEAVEELLEKKKAEPEKKQEETMACGCPGSMAVTMTPKSAANEDAGDVSSELSHWPVKLKLLNPSSPFLKNADILLMADCAGVAYPNLHKSMLKGHAVAIGCPKFDDLDEHIQKLADIISQARPASLSVVYMEVPCCRGLVYAAEKAIKASGADVPLELVKIGRNGEVVERENFGQPAAKASCNCC